MTKPQTPDLEDEIGELVGAVMPRATVLGVERLGPDEEPGAEGTGKAIGYGVPLRIRVRAADGAARDLCLHTAKPDDFGHDRRADRAANTLLAFDTFGDVPRHVRALDVGAVMTDGRLVSLRDSGEYYLVTEYAEGHVYAEDLRRIAHDGALSEADVPRCTALARLLADIHSVRKDAPAVYRRAIRDLVGHGEGIFGLVDGYPDGVPMAPPEPADDVMCLAINYIFFALEAPGSWRGAFRTLWRTFFKTYLDATGDHGIFSAAPPFLAWRALVLCNPRWYPLIHASTRDALLGLVERALDAPQFDPEDVERLFP
jgi:hypothetical protein